MFVPNQRDTLQLLGSIDRAVHDALNNPSLPEPSLVAYLVWRITQRLNTLSLSGGISITAGGIFVHGRPTVYSSTFPKTTPRSVEIGDLLLIRNDLVNGVLKERRAILLQAKKAKKIPTKPDNDNQYHLYSTWPSFEYSLAPASLKGQKRHITGTDLSDASKYLIISESANGLSGRPSPCSCTFFPGSPNPNCLSVTAHPSLPLLSHYACFVGDVFGFIIGNTGKVFQSPAPAGSIGWDKVIEDLTTITAMAGTKWMQPSAAGGQGKRGAGVLQMCQVSGGFHDQSNFPTQFIDQANSSDINSDRPPESPDERQFQGDEEGGISILEFTVSRGDDNYRDKSK